MIHNENYVQPLKKKDKHYKDVVDNKNVHLTEKKKWMEYSPFEKSKPLKSNSFSLWETS